MFSSPMLVDAVPVAELVQEGNTSFLAAQVVNLIEDCQPP